MSRLGEGIAIVALLGLLAGCGADPLASGAEGCWGLGGDCSEALDASLRALGHRGTDGIEQAMAGGACAGLVDCSQVVASVDPEPTPRPRATPTPRRGDDDRPTPLPRATPAAVVGGVTPTPTPTPEPTPEPTPVATPEPTPDPTPEPIASASCAGMTIASLESKAKHTGAEQTCLTETAHGRTGAGDADVQIAAITLANTKAPGWAKAVTAALKRGSLSNAPQLNFAGIGPAYSGKQYATVLKRARVVWNNRGKGYQLSGTDLTYVVEYACRSAGQLALSGKPASDGLDWCERWLDRAERAGQATGPIEDLIRQVE